MAHALVQLSKFLSLVLRHDPARIGLRLDAAGWVDVDELVEKANTAGTPLSRALVLRIVETSDKQRFALCPEQRRIRANQGHSVAVELGLSPVVPPEGLYHGTAVRFLASILATGLSPRSRQHVHLSPDLETATRVGRRHGEPVVLRVAARALHDTGQAFFCAENGVWLTSSAPARYLRVIQPGESP